MNALEQSFAALCVEHDLTSLSVGYTPANTNRFAVYAHAEFRLCAQGIGTTIAQAVGNAIAGLHAKRGTAEPIALPDEPLPELAA